MTVDGRDDPVRAWIADRIAAGRMPGASWWVEGARGVVSRGALGSASVEPVVEPADLDTVYDLASLTKPLVTALLAVLLEQDRALRLEAPVRSLLPELHGTAYAEVSALELGSHRTGLPAWRPLYLEASDRAGYVRSIARTEPAGPRGQERYSDLGYILLGIAIERLAGEDLATLFETRVARPLGLRRTGFAVGGEPLAHAAPTERGNRYERAMVGAVGTAHVWRESVIRGSVHDANAHAVGGVAGHAGLFGPVAEVVTIAREWLTEGRLRLGGPARDRILSPVRPGAGRTFGLEVARRSSAARGVLRDDAVGHVGFTGTSLWIDRVRGAVFALLTNRVHPEVDGADFQEVRAGFHARARRLLDATEHEAGADV